MKIVTVVGARPQFIKAAAISRAIRRDYKDRIEEVLVHTGQHHDENMSRVFFKELDVPEPRYNLEVAGGRHGQMTGRMLERIETVLEDEHPDWVLTYGDTNSTLAGALAAAKLKIPVAHVEAGLRSFNKQMPEEINRILVDHASELLFCPTETAVANLSREGINEGVHNVGDVTYDLALGAANRARKESRILAQLALHPRGYILATCHRAENTDNPHRLRNILEALRTISENCKVILPLHPRSQASIEKHGFDHLLSNLRVTGPLSFLDMVALEQDAKCIITDSGGVQKEAFFHRVPCITTRDETEWVETVQTGWNRLTGADCEKILFAASRLEPGVEARPYGTGQASKQIIEILLLAQIPKR